MEANAQAAQAFPFPDLSVHIERLDNSIAAGNAWDQLQETIETNITALEAATLRLRASRNSCRPLLRLPLETLGEIIAILASRWPSTNGYSMVDFVGSKKIRTGLELGWILLGHVCRKLRAAVLARSDLWASNICNITRSPEELGLYYGNSPLHIDLEIYNPHNGSPGLPTTYVDFIARHMNLSRVVRLLEFGKWSDGALFANLDPGIFAKLTFPHLNQLELLSDTSPYGINPVMTVDIFELPEMIAPNLHTLHLKNCMLSFDPSTLTSLALEYGQPTTLYSAQKFLNMLRRAPNIRTLHLRNCIPPLSSGVAGAEIIALTFLQDLHLEDNIRRCLSLLSHISSLPSSRYHVEVDDVHAEFPGAGLPEALNAFLPQIAHLDTSQVSGLTIGEWTVSNITLFCPTPGAHCPTSFSGPFRNDFQEKMCLEFYPISGNMSRIEDTLSCIQHTIDLSTVDTLQVGSYIMYDPTIWAACFARFINLTTLYLDMRRTWALLALMVPDHDEPRQMDLERITLPRLRFLWIAILDLREPRSEDGAQRRGPNRLQVLRMLSSRMRAGVLLEHLRIDTLIVLDPKEARRSFIPRLEALVSCVEVRRIAERDPDTETEDDDDEEGEDDEEDDVAGSGDADEDN